MMMLLSRIFKKRWQPKTGTSEQKYQLTCALEADGKVIKIFNGTRKAESREEAVKIFPEGLKINVLSVELLNEEA